MNGTGSQNTAAREAAERYLRAGVMVIPVPAGEKNPNRRGWQKERHAVEDVPRLWNNGQGIGALWGEPSGGRIDVDLDWPEARIAAGRILPDTRSFGRPSARESHRVMSVTGKLPPSKKYKLPGKGPDRCVVELLSTGAQSLVPPSLHESGEQREWHRERTAAEIDGKELRERVADVASAALIACNWPGQGARHDYALAATGYVGRHLPRERAERVMEAAIAASGDEEVDGRLTDVRTTLDGIDAGTATTGGPTLDGLAPGVVDRLCHWHGWGARGVAAEPGVPTQRATDSGAGIIKRLADEITAEEHFAKDPGERLHRFSGGTYRQYADRYIRRRVKELTERWGESKRWSSHLANEVVEYVRADAPELWERPPLHEVNVMNGILNVETKALRAHNPGFLSPVQIPVAYDPGARCPEWDKFVAAVFPNDAEELAFELASDLITPSRSAQKAVLLLGEGSNGKSTFLRALTAFTGTTNASGVSLHKLESDRFATSRLIGKLANICPDLPSTHLTETSVFKAITGGDSLHAEYKYRESFEFDPYCRLVFSANHVPRSGDASHAFFRRWLVVPFARTFEPGEQVSREVLDAALSNPAELSGVLNRALGVVGRVRRKGFTESESMREAWDEFKTMTDPVSVWMERNTITDPNAVVAKGVLWESYNAACERQGRSGMTSTAFGLAVKRARPGIDDAQRTVNGKPRVKVWLGIGLRTPGGDGPDDGPDDDPGGGARNPRNPRNPVSLSVSSLKSEGKKGGEEEGEEAKDNNKRNRVTSVTSVTLGGDTSEPGRRLAVEEAERVQRLVSEGMSARLARAEVLGKGVTGG